jgi:hypothetical protein
VAQHKAIKGLKSHNLRDHMKAKNAAKPVKAIKAPKAR